MELEQSQLRAQQAEGQLKHLLAAMTIPLKGKDALLDQDLLTLRSTLQGSQLNDLKPLSESMQHKIRLLDNPSSNELS